jgi:phospholipid/cholesterol/gamma-HCH transport system ATP-binding protein
MDNSHNKESRGKMLPQIKPHIIVRDLTMAYGDFVVMHDLTFTIHRGDIFIIMGGSGCGKSTMMTILIGLKSPAKGQVSYGDVDFWGSDSETRDRIIRGAGVTYQGGALWSSMTLAENIALPLEEYTDLNSAQIREVIELKLALVGLAGFEEFYPSEISGGMQKRAGIARAMALDPEILFFDEPSAGLDPVSARRLDDLILQLRENLGTTMVVVTHELASIFTIGNNSVFLDAEKRTMTATGDPKKLLAETQDHTLRMFLTRGEDTSATKTPRHKEGI